MKFDVYEYAIQTRRITEDGQMYFKGTAAEFPHLATYEDTAQEAYDILIEDIKELYVLSQELGHAFPLPGKDESHSGRLTTRLPKSLHRALDIQAAKEGISLNLHVATLLADAAACKSIASEVSNTIKAVARNAITAAVLIRGKSSDIEVAAAAGYSNSAQVDIPKGEDKWIVRH